MLISPNLAPSRQRFNKMHISLLNDLLPKSDQNDSDSGYIKYHETTIAHLTTLIPTTTKAVVKLSKEHRLVPFLYEQFGTAMMLGLLSICLLWTCCYCCPRAPRKKAIRPGEKLSEASKVTIGSSEAVMRRNQNESDEESCSEFPSNI